MQEQATPTIRTAAQQIVEARFDRPVRELLQELLVDRGLTIAATAAELGVHEATIGRWMADFGLVLVRRGGQRTIVPAPEVQS